jgi:hypothetical protein
MTLTKGKSIVLAAVALVAIPVVTSLAPSFAAAGERHVIKIDPSGQTPLGRQAAGAWSGDATLHDSSGKEIYRWHESHHAGEDFVRWEYPDAGDGGWIDLTIGQKLASGKEKVHNYTKLALGENHCYALVGPEVNEFSAVVDQGNCPFN